MLQAYASIRMERFRRKTSDSLGFDDKLKRVAHHEDSEEVSHLRSRIAEIVVEQASQHVTGDSRLVNIPKFN